MLSGKHQEEYMRKVHVFKSQKKTDFYGFTEFPAGDNLPSDGGPRVPTGKIIELPARKGLIGLNPDELEANLNKHGFHTENVTVEITVKG